MKYLLLALSFLIFFHVFL